MRVRIPKKLYESLKQRLNEGSALESMFATYGVDKGDLTNEFIEDLLAALSSHFRVYADELTNMDAMGIQQDIASAYNKLRKRTSN